MKKENKPEKPRSYPQLWRFNLLKVLMPGFFKGQRKNANEKVYYRYLQHVRFKQIDVAYLLLLVVLSALGLATMFSASYASSINITNDNIGYYYAQRQAIFFLAGFAAIAVLCTDVFDYHMTRSLFANGVIFGLGVLLMVLVLVAGKADPNEASAIAGDDAGGATRWLSIGGFRFQPSEFMKICLIFALSRILSVNADRIGSGASRAEEIIVCIKCFVLIGGTAVLMYKQPHLSGMIIICAIGLSMMFISGIRFSTLMGFSAVGIVGAVAVVYKKYTENSYVTDRINGWLYTWDEANGDIAWQTRNSLIAIGSGGWWGLGFRNSRQKFLYLPEPHNDFIFSVICEELGIAGGLIIITLFLMLTLRGVKVAMNAPDRYGTLLASGISMHFILQVLLNVAVVSNAIPNTGISLPFFSYGGSAVVIQLIEAGLLLNISKQYFEKDSIEKEQKSAELIKVDRQAEPAPHSAG
ncbi:MAG: FtsW/RodA/SpoVE family cell cycle protein [Oscillospiraceae bacterium]|nr:FtsW/RodA/SpoVE family cell cycle protein [Oscillospiraceae bacterium]